MIDNNLDFDVALYPYELVTYGETGQVCQNWMQYLLIKKYLETMSDDQTLVVSSGHPVGLFPSHKMAPRVISTNGLLVGEWDNPDNFRKLAALGVTNYGQMTAGSWIYIGTQGILQGTYETLASLAAQKGWPSLKGKFVLSAGLGGSGGAHLWHHHERRGWIDRRKLIPNGAAPAGCWLSWPDCRQPGFCTRDRQ